MNRKNSLLIALSISAALAIAVACGLGLLPGLTARACDLESINEPGSRPASSAPTFSRDVAPIMFDKCASCHRPGEIAPMSLLTYKDARPWARAIKEKVLNKTMPPWHADPQYGKFRNDRSLRASEIDTIVRWVDGGAPEGDPKQLPAVPRFGEGWKIGKPDVVLTMATKFEVPAEGVLDYKYFTVPTHFTEDRWVQAAEVRVGNRAVVHHVIVFVRKPREKTNGERDAGLEAITGVAPGEEPVVLPDGVGILVRAGSVLVFQMHYTPNGVAQSDQTSVGLIFSRKPVIKESQGGAAMNARFAIPPGDPAYEVSSSETLDADCHITSLMPHMHVRGKDFQYRLVYPDGSSKILLSVPRYDFNWQTRYEFVEPVAAPKGSRVDCIAHFDNSTGNKSNPDPSKTVRWGPQTWDEMMIGFLEFTLDHQQLARRSEAVLDRSVKQSAATAETKVADKTSAESLPAVNQVIAKYVEAIGGDAAVRAHTSRVLKGTIDIPSLGADGTIVIYSKAPNKQLTETSSPMLGVWRQGFDGSAAWEDEDGEIRVLPAFPRRDADFYLPIRLGELFPKITVKGREKIGNRQAYCLEAPRSGNPKRWYFDVETNLLIRTEVRNAAGVLISSEEYDDYRAVEGVRIPFLIRQVDEDAIPVVVRLSSVQTDVSIDDKKFERPQTK